MAAQRVYGLLAAFIIAFVAVLGGLFWLNQQSLEQLNATVSAKFEALGTTQADQNSTQIAALYDLAQSVASGQAMNVTAQAELAATLNAQPAEVLTQVARFYPSATPTPANTSTVTAMEISTNATGVTLTPTPILTDPNLTLWSSAGLVLSAWSPNGQYLGGADKSGMIYLYEMITGTEIWRQPFLATAPTYLLWSADNQHLIFGNTEVAYQMVDVEQPTIINSSLIRGTQNRGSALGGALSPDEKYLATYSREEIVIWDLTNGGIFARQQREFVSQIGWLNSNQLIYTRGSTLYQVNLDKQKFSELTTLYTQTDELQSLAVDPTTGQVAFTDKTHQIQLYDIARGEIYHTLSGTIPIQQLVWSTNHQRLAVLDANTLRIWNIETARPIFELPLTELFNHFTWSANEQQIMLSNTVSTFLINFDIVGEDFILATPTAIIHAATPTLTTVPLDTILQRAQAGITSNADWEPFTYDFGDGIPMVLVPKGCFRMGVTEEQLDLIGGLPEWQDAEMPATEICFDAPFWIDETEITQANFRRLGGKQAKTPYFTGEQRPVERITWLEAQAFCEARGGRLPTEAEWEYAARGADGLFLPWGNRFLETNVIYHSTAGGETANVQSRPNGISWVGAYDLSGNVWEWTLSAYKAYPYLAGDGREADLDNPDVERTARGGSWFTGSPWDLLTVVRYGNKAGDNNSVIGFRCARLLE